MPVLDGKMLHQRVCSTSGRQDVPFCNARQQQRRAPCHLRQTKQQHITTAAAATQTPNLSSKISGQPTTEGYSYREPAPWPTDVLLPPHDLDAVPYVDLIVTGAGPAGVAVAERVAAAGFSVCIMDPSPHAIWPNNYGVWVDEFQAMGLMDCLEVVWPKARVWLDSSPTGEKCLDRPYGRVDRPLLKRKLLEKCVANGVTFLNAKVDSVSHADGSSTVKAADGRLLRGSLVLDATGHSRKLVEYDQPFNPGYQGAYGIMAEVESHPFPLDTMLFMDWRDDHLTQGTDMQAANAATPTFLYAMPFTATKVFLEETSLVARPAVGFKELKERLEIRLKSMGIKVTRVEEEDGCWRWGGTAGMVHPSTGFMVARTLGAAPTVADAIIDQLSSPSDKANTAGVARMPSSEAEANRMASAVWAAIWPLERIRQRSFFTFGMDVLLKLDLKQTREFFSAFFSLSKFHWHGFLSTRLSFTELLGFGIALFLNASNSARANLLVQGVPGLIAMLAGLLPTLRDDYYGLKSLRAVKGEVDAAAKATRSSSKGAPSSPPSDKPQKLVS
ncbi:MAG: hypothetical protein WDW38_009587 [Sanguina aurantia]